MRAFLYARVSTSDKGQDVENQLPEMRRFVETRNWKLRREYIDYVNAGGKKVREQFDEMLEACDRGEADVVIIWALDRFSREGPLRTMLLMDRLARAGVKVKSMKEPWLDPDSPLYELLLPLFAWVARQERRRLSERVLAGLERARRNGAKLGRPKVFADVARIRQLRAAGLSYRAIGGQLGMSDGTVRTAIRRAANASKKPAKRLWKN